MPVKFEVSDVFPVSMKALYTAWLSSDEHSLMTGSPAKVSDQVGECFEAWDGYIEGKNLELEPYSCILQLWRTSEFEESAPDSFLEIHLEPEGAGTRLTIQHSNLPEDGMQYKQGWIDSYFAPMHAYFGSDSDTEDF